MKCIRMYGYASGQRVNFQKSSIIFDSQVSEESKLVVRTITGIEKEGGEDTYMGLPECFSGSKRKIIELYS